jgi:hypothetical protein
MPVTESLSTAVLVKETRKRKLLIIPALISGLSIFDLPANATENRCGWLQNPTPANWWLTDRHGTWTISAQGGYQARGIDNMPPLSDREYVTTNGSYGYGCACLRVVTDRKQMRIISIQSGRQLPLKTCRQDPNLPKNP